MLAKENINQKEKLELIKKNEDLQKNLKKQFDKQLNENQ